MTIDSILSQIDAEIARLTQARTLLSSANKISSSAGSAHLAGSSGKNGRRKRVLSPEARKRIADAQRKRWAAQRAKKAK